MEQWVFQQTADGSPTLSFGPGGEWMHHRAGAFSESLYVYGEALKIGFDTIDSPLIFSVGLGLGYLETLASAFAISRGKQCRLISFEADPDLRAQTDPRLIDAYRTIQTRAAAEFELSPDAIARCLSQWKENGTWLIEGPISDASVNARAGIVLFDAFSAQTDSSLWKETFLDEFLTQSCAGVCVFATYASTGVLKRSLQRHGFRLIKRDGFSGKRECTLAIRTTGT